MEYQNSINNTGYQEDMTAFSKVSRIKQLKEFYIKLTIVMAIIVPTACWFFFPDWNVFDGALSNFGLGKTGHFWNSYLLATALGLYLNGITQINKRYVDKLKRQILFSVLSISCYSLVLTALITMDIRLPHHIVAASFFFGYMFFIFLYGAFQMRSRLRKALFSVISSGLLIISSSLVFVFNGLAIFEICFMAIITCWNLIVFLRK
jgi:hypothetical membrane protein